MPTEYTLQELAKLADVTPRTVRYYIAQGLLPSPTQAGSAARYNEAHLERLRLIKKLQAAHLPLAAIRAQFRGMGDEQIATMADSTPVEPSRTSAVDYIRSLLGEPPLPRPGAAPARPPTRAAVVDLDDAGTFYRRAADPEPPASAIPAAPAPAPGQSAPPPPATTSQSEPDRAQWERVSISPDIELHIRRPLTRLQNRRVERLISIARQLIEED